MYVRLVFRSTHSLLRENRTARKHVQSLVAPRNSHRISFLRPTSVWSFQEETHMPPVLTKENI